MYQISNTLRTKGLEADDDSAAAGPGRPPTREENANQPTGPPDSPTVATEDMPAPPALLSQQQAPPLAPPSTTGRSLYPQVSETNEAMESWVPPEAAPATRPTENNTSLNDQQFNVKAFMAQVGTRNGDPEAQPLVNPGAVSVHGIHSSRLESDEDTSTVATNTPRITVAQLAPDDEHVAQRVAERIERQMTEQWNERLKQEVEAQLLANTQTFPTTTTVAEPVPAEPVPATTNGSEAEVPSTPPKMVDDNFVVCGLRRRTWGVVLIVFLLLAVAAAVGLVLTVQQDNTLPPTLSPTASPTGNDATRLLDRIGPTIAPTSADRAVIGDDTTAQYQAFHWLVTRDDWQDVSDIVLVERYALAVLYFSTGGPTHWQPPQLFTTIRDYCAWNTGVHSEDTNGKGVLCENGRVKDLYLQGIGLTGELPWELVLLEKLSVLLLDNNSIRGTLPTQLSSLTQLRAILLHSNFLTGSIPLDSLPSSLQSLDVTANDFVGTLPPELATTVPFLSFLSLASNRLKGSLPNEWSTLARLEGLVLDDNGLTGAIPTGYGDLTKLLYLFLEENELNGALPTELGQLKLLQEFFVSHNQLTGTIPAQYSELSNLRSFLFEGNDLTGSLENTICADSSPLASLQALRGDCAGSNPEITCPCCTTCCQADGNSCQANRS